MKKTLYIPILALALAACQEREQSIFPESAAERLEQSRTEYKDALTADGGLWTMEYFTNTDEPGYVLLMQFSPTGAVEVSADHKWIGGTFKQETSMWDVISDNASVLTFNTYNRLFHIFATPENIEGPNAPKNDDGEDINELGYGHEGDYEFMLMHLSDNEIKLQGKKHGMIAWLRRLSPDTDPEAYLKAINDKRAQFSDRFPVYTLSEATGQTYAVKGLGDGIVEVYPYDFGDIEADPVTQTVKAHGIITAKGFRFRNPLTVKRADDTTWELAELTWDDRGSLSNTDGVSVSGPSPQEALAVTSYTWTVDTESFTGDLAEAFDTCQQALIAYGGASSKINSITMSWSKRIDRMMPLYTFTIGRRLCRDNAEMEWADPATVTGEIKYPDTSSQRYDQLVPEFAAFKQALGGTFLVSKASELDPSTLMFSSGTSSFSIRLN